MTNIGSLKLIFTEMDECYDHLAEVLTTLNSYIEQQELTVQHNGNAYDVIVNSSSLSGVSVCEPGHIPVWQYCGKYLNQFDFM